MKTMLDCAIREARDDLGTLEAERLDWRGVERSVFDRIEEARRTERIGLASGRRPRFMALTLGIAASVAIAAVALRNTNDPLLFDAPRLAAADLAGTIVNVGGEVLVNGKAAAAGMSLRLGDLMETRGAAATVNRPGKLSLIVERGSRLSVTHVGATVILALQEGAIEAQVVPVSAGEAFAVDVGPSRVAVHGTHLRVAYSGERVIVDLTEGVVTISEAPRVGSELGTLVTAPAHAAFEASNARATLEVKHEPSVVRAPSLVLGAAEPRAASGASTLAGAALPERGEPRAWTPVSARADAGKPAAAAGPSTSPSADANPQSTLASGVRGCMAERPRAENVKVVVSTRLHLELFDDGTVRSARFDPPVAADVNTCAAALIYKSRFASPGSIEIPIDF